MKKRRFIAGAVCPRCAVMDRIFIYNEGQTSVRECLDCGYKDYMARDEVTEEITTRVNKNESGEIISEFKTVSDSQAEKEQRVDRKSVPVEPVHIMIPTDRKIH